MRYPSRSLCIHGHFYQPPREDPWLGRILVEPSAAPMRHWNERIVKESYAPLAWARRLAGDGKIFDIVNCYEWISFNVGPTLMHWLERHAPESYNRILEADAASLDRWGHGNAMAQVYHHVIMPLASPLDKELETAWAVADFTARFKRAPEGMWLAECAVDLPSLEVLANYGIRFVSLAPRQARAVIGRDGSEIPVDEGSLDIRKPYRVDLPSGRSMTVIFYHGGLSQAVAFEGLLRDGERFWTRLRDAAYASGGTGPELLTVSTDGETYGHHFPFGEMALAYVLAQGREGRDDLRLTNFASYIAANPPMERVLLHEPSSWSCVHGVERWRSNCGCTDGGHPDWNQQWRGPLRRALNDAKKNLDEHFFKAGAACFKDPKAALLGYGLVLAEPDRADEFMALHGKGGPAEAEKGWRLLAMQEQALAAYASCAWFFDEISRLEPVNSMTFMWRALELAGQTGMGEEAHAEKEHFAALLEEAASNKPEEGSGRDILTRRVFPRQQDAASLTLIALITLQQEGRFPEPGSEGLLVWPSVTVAIVPDAVSADGELTGKAMIRGFPEKQGYAVTWHWLPPSREAVRHFVPLARSRVRVEYADGTIRERTVAELSRPVKDFLSLSESVAANAADRDRLLAVARHAVSLMSAWEEGQSGEPYPGQWAALMPYLLAACILDEELAGDRRKASESFLRALQPERAVREKAGDLLVELMLEALAKEPDQGVFTKLAGWAARSGALLPEVSWWPVQNVLWRLGTKTPGRAALAEAVGLKLEP